jgi:hypothetical protein
MADTLRRLRAQRLGGLAWMWLQLAARPGSPGGLVGYRHG